MSENQGSSNSLMVIPSFGKSPELRMEMQNIRLAESRLIEAKSVNPFTYPDLEHTFNESYRDLKKYIASIGYSISTAEKALEDAKADVVLGSYKEYITINPKEANADTRNAFLAKDEAYTAALDRIAQLKALEANLDGKMKVMENVCRYMRKQMDLVLRSGMTGKDYYNTQGKK